MKNKLIIYSDCFTYSGSENVIENILSSKIINNEFDIKFCFAYNKAYASRFWSRMGKNINVETVAPLTILSRGHVMSFFRNKDNPLVKRILSLLMAMIIYFCEFIFVGHIYNFLRLWVYFKKNSPKILYINNGGYPGAVSCRIAVLAARFSGTKHIVFNVNNMAYRPKSIFDRFLDYCLTKYVSCFVTASFAAQRQLIDARKFDVIKFRRIPNTLFEENIFLGSDCNVSFSKEILNVGSVGLLTFRKGYHVLIDAVKQIVENNNVNFKLYIIGDGEERENLQKQIEFNHLEKNVVLLGYKSNPLIYLNHFDIFVLPSVSNEDFPYVILEAMYLSKPLVGTNVAGIPEQIEDEVNGFIAQPNSSIDLADKLMKLMNRRQDLDKMGIRSKKKYESNFSYNRVMGEYLNLFKEMLNKKSG